MPFNLAKGYLNNIIKTKCFLAGEKWLEDRQKCEFYQKEKKNIIYALRKEYYLSEEERVYGGAAGEDDKREGDRHTDHKAQFHQVCNN